MERFFITTESTADLPSSRLAALHIPIARVYCSASGGIAGEDEPSGALSRALLDALRHGGSASTAMIGTARWEAFFRPLLAAGYDVLHLAVSSGLSSSCACACLAAKTLSDLFPKRRLLVVDTLSVSGGQGLIVERTAAQKSRGFSMLACRDYAEKQRLSVQHLITAEGVSTLLQSGRLAASSPFEGGKALLRPILELDAQGRMALRERANGRLSSLRAMKNRFARAYDERLNTRVRLLHAGCPEDAARLAAMLREDAPTLEIEILPAGAATGLHTGPGGLGLFFLGHGRH